MTKFAIGFLLGALAGGYAIATFFAASSTETLGDVSFHAIYDPEQL